MTEDDEFELEPIEGYCVRCRTRVELENSVPVWTRKGQPATRGDCSLCGGAVFRMGKTEAHQEKNRPSALHIGDEDDKRTRAKLTRETVYVAYCVNDEETAQQLASDLEKSGLSVWLHDTTPSETAWASGVHPALKACARLVLLWSPNALEDASLGETWGFFKQSRKPIVLAQVGNSAPPEALRRSPRFALDDDYKGALRQLLNTLSL